MKTTSQQNNGEPSPLANEQQSRGDAPDGSGLRDLFRHFLALEADGRSVNDRKAKVFAKAKADGFDPKHCGPPSDNVFAKWKTQRKPRSTTSTLTAIW
jgi:hypothetical protein